MIVIIDRTFDFVALILVALALSYLMRARSTHGAQLLRRASLFLWLVILVEILEDVVEIPLFGFMQTFDDEDAIALEVITLFQAVMAIYYASRARGEKAIEFLDFSILCTIWLALAYALEASLGLVFLE